MSHDKEVEVTTAKCERTAPAVRLGQVSVVVPTFNSARWIHRFVANTARPTAGAVIVVVDDNSRDGTHDRLRQLETSHPQLRVIQNEHNLGQLQATLAGCATVETEWILTIDDDWDLTSEVVNRILAKASDSDIVYCQIHGHSVFGVRGLSYLARRAGPLFGVPRHVCDASSTRLFRRALIDAESAVPLDVQLAASPGRVTHCALSLTPLDGTRTRHTLASRLLMAGSYLRHRGRPQADRE